MSHSGSENGEPRDESRRDDAAFETPDPEEFLEDNSTAAELDGDISDGGDDDEGRPMVPEGVLRGIDDIREGRTADVDDIRDALNY